MLPIILDVSCMRIAVIGQGPQAIRRLRLVDAAQAHNVHVYSADADDEFREKAGERLIDRLPTEDELASFNVAYVAGVAEEEEERLTSWARAHKTLINVEDVRPRCDFHVPATVRRGDLLLTVSTGGKSPGLARRLQKDLEHKYPELWAERLNELAAAREAWRAQGLSFSDLISRTDQYIREKEWFDE